MRRISLIIFAALALVLLVSAYGQTPTQQTNRNTQAQQTTQVQQTKRDTLFTPAMRSEYVQLMKSRAGKTDVRAWARKYKLEIVHLKDYDILVPEQPPTRGQPEAVGACDATKCSIVIGFTAVTNTQGSIVGWQDVRCNAKSCKWLWNKDLKSYTRICGDWKCENFLSIYQVTNATRSRGRGFQLDSWRDVWNAAALREVLGFRD